jgi:hypothetical protein
LLKVGCDKQQSSLLVNMIVRSWEDLWKQDVRWQEQAILSRSIILIVRAPGRGVSGMVNAESAVSIIMVWARRLLVRGMPHNDKSSLYGIRRDSL